MCNNSNVQWFAELHLPCRCMAITYNSLYSGNNKFNCGFPIYLVDACLYKSGKWLILNLICPISFCDRKFTKFTWQLQFFPSSFSLFIVPCGVFQLLFFYLLVFYQRKQTDVILTSFSDPHNFNWVHWTFTNIGQKAEGCFFVKNVTRYIWVLMSIFYVACFVLFKIWS